MRKYYTRPCNFYYGSYAKKLINKNKAYSLAGRTDIAFDQIEILIKNKKKNIKSRFFKISEINSMRVFVIVFVLPCLVTSMS